MVCTRVPHEKIAGPAGDQGVGGARPTTNGDGRAGRPPGLPGDRAGSAGVDLGLLAAVLLHARSARAWTVWLVNAPQVKNVPGRPKTDKIDAVWLAKLAETVDGLGPSFVPAEPMRDVRDLARARFDLVEDRTRVKQRMEKLLEDALVKISVVLTDIHGVSGRAIIEALIAGERNPKRLAELAKGRARAQPRRPEEGAARPLHRPPRPAGPDAAGPDRRAAPRGSTRSPPCSTPHRRHPRRARPPARVEPSTDDTGRGHLERPGRLRPAVERTARSPAAARTPSARSSARSAWT